MEGLSEDKDTAAGSEDDLVDRVYLYLKDNAYPMQSSATNLVEILWIAFIYSQDYSTPTLGSNLSFDVMKDNFA
eukprot:Em0488g2a